MRCRKILLFLIFIFALALSWECRPAAKAADTLTITLRVEQDEYTLIPPVQVTLTEADKKDYGIGLPTDIITPLHALAKYMIENRGATEETMKNYITASRSSYGLFVTGISTDGISDGSPAAGTQDNVSWMFAVNNTYPSVSMDTYELKDRQSVVFYGLWSGGIWPDVVETNYCFFDKTTFRVSAGSRFCVCLNGLGYDENGNAILKKIEGASVIASPSTGSSGSMALKRTAIAAGTTDKNGNAFLTISTPGTYVLSAYRTAADGIHTDISRPYATVTVTKRNAPSVSFPPADSVKKEKKPKTISAPAKPKSIKAVVKKSKKKKKTVKLTWKKVKKAAGYRIAISKKKKKGYKKLADTKKPTFTFKRKKGVYYIKVTAYVKSGGRRLYGKAGRILRIKIKKWSDRT